MTGKNPGGLRITLEAAADCIHAANYQTLPHEGAPGLEYPADVYAALGNLKLLCQYLPQLAGQIGDWLMGEYAAGKVASDTGTDAGAWVMEAAAALMTASSRAEDMAQALSAAQNATSSLKAAR